MSRVRCAAVVLAAGESARMGSPKQMLEYRGRPLLRHGAERALEAGCDPVVVVLGAQVDQIAGALDGLPVVVATNPRWKEGMGTSIQAGLRMLENRAIDGAILMLGDQPLVDASFLAGLSATSVAHGKRIVASRYDGTVGVPVYFAREAFELLFELSPNQGCKGVILSHFDDAWLVDCPEASIDIDTPDDYARLRV